MYVAFLEDRLESCYRGRLRLSYDTSGSTVSTGLRNMILKKVPYKVTVLGFCHSDQFHIPNSPLMQEKVQLEGATGKLGRSVSSL